MDESNSCFICAENCEDTYYFLINLTSKKFKTKFTVLISDLINKEYELRVSENNKVCGRCCILLEKYDELQQETKTVKSILSRQIANTYEIETSEELVFLDNSKTFIKLNPSSSSNLNEIKYSCKLCRYVTVSIDNVNSHCLYHKILTESKIQTNEIIKEVTPAVKRNPPVGRESKFQTISTQSTQFQPHLNLTKIEEVVTEMRDVEEDNEFVTCQEYDEECLESLIDLDLLEDETYDSNLKNQKCMMVQCNAEFKYIVDYVKHLKQDHKTCTLNHIFAVIRANIKRPKKLSKFTCPYCYSKAPNIEMFEEHVKHHEDAAKSKMFTDRINEFVHNLIKLSNYGTRETENHWICKHCSKPFNDSKMYNNHLAIQHRCCFICFSQCEDKLILKDHIFSHTSHSEFKCPFCNDIFQTKPDRLLHLQLNHKEICCNFCSEWFESIEDLNQHARFSHADRKSEEVVVNICDSCGASFKNQSLLQNHQQVEHKKRKIYTCSACRESFRFRYLLMDHISSAHKRVIVDNETNFYKCFVCMQGFSSQNRAAFIKHLGEHQTSNSFCVDCNVDCTSFYHLEAHRERCHQDFSLQGMNLKNFPPTKKPSKPMKTVSKPVEVEIPVKKENQVEPTQPPAPELFNVEEQIMVQTEDGSLLNVKDAMNIILTENGELLIQNLDELLPNEDSSNGQIHITNLEQFLMEQSNNEISYIQHDEEVVVDNNDQSHQESLMQTYKEIFEPTEEMVEVDGDGSAMEGEYIVQVPLDQHQNYSVAEQVEINPVQIDANQSTLDELGDILLEVAKAAEKEKKPKITENKVIQESLWGRKRSGDPVGAAKKRSSTTVENEPASNFSQAYELFVKGFDAKKHKNL